MPTVTVSREQLYRILATHIGLDRDAIGGGSTLTDLGVDSIGVIELDKVLEDEFGRTLPEDSPAMTLDQILHHINSLEGEG
ncbi:acyl carrier protein [Streptomyces sp. NPDC001668]|uniref:acyl carrier protein n=1 Tax=unclassified Streptomyces TaxID=2593676 RepID=UPI0033EA9360